MVVCMIVHIANTTPRTFTLRQASDPLYKPSIAGEPCGSESVEIPPCFDKPADALVVPWASIPWHGFIVGEANSAERVHCTVGPTQESPDVDWLQLHDEHGEPLTKDTWLPLGRRHVLGMMGEVVDLSLIFREDFDISTPSEIPKNIKIERRILTLAKCLRFDREVASAAENTVFLNVYDLASTAFLPNAILCNTLFKTLGAFHAAIEVYGEEWSFYKQADDSACGIGKSRHPRHHHVHVYRQSVNLGPTHLTFYEVRHLLQHSMIPDWRSGRYDLLRCNCIHFCQAFASMLGAKQVPPWVSGLHETGAAIFRFPSYIAMGGHSGNGGVYLDGNAASEASLSSSARAKRNQNATDPKGSPAAGVASSKDTVTSEIGSVPGASSVQDISVESFALSMRSAVDVVAASVTNPISSAWDAQRRSIAVLLGFSDDRGVREAEKKVRRQGTSTCKDPRRRLKNSPLVNDSVDSCASPSAKNGSLSTRFSWFWGPSSHHAQRESEVINQFKEKWHDAQETRESDVDD
eukprot:TRINITY_DN57538_c0_g1_i1.p1 TRINITY_DN57538_c0_g1~~TRINITY_DN57538_c0_g1_i1.p1  ORF type:complete len:521 (-),score=67.68 TRINITY_DN57538_c0_g1_i1:113-1675(-)